MGDDQGDPREKEDIVDVCEDESSDDSDSDSESSGKLNDTRECLDVGGENLGT